jgi:hypothetical protein
MIFKFIKTVLTTCRYAMCISLGVLSVSGTVSATLIESIAALDDGSNYRVLFVTSTQRDAMTSDIGKYNTLVSIAAAAGTVTKDLGLSWTALGSTATVNAQTNTGIMNDDTNPVTLFNTLGEIIALSGADFWDGSIDNLINYDESGVANTSYRTLVITGTNQDGTTSSVNHLGQSNPYEWVTYGLTSRTDYFVAGTGYYAEYTGKFYGVSSLVMKPIKDVPEPGAVILLSLGLAGLSFARYRRQS